MKKIIHQFTETGEVRVPRDNEWYYNAGDNNSSICVNINTGLRHPILTYERIEEDWKPKDGDEFYFIDVVGNLRGANYRENAHYPYFAYGNYFATVELAEEKLKQIKEILK